MTTKHRARRLPVALRPAFFIPLALLLCICVSAAWLIGRGPAATPLSPSLVVTEGDLLLAKVGEQNVSLPLTRGLTVALTDGLSGMSFNNGSGRRHWSELMQVAGANTPIQIEFFDYQSDREGCGMPPPLADLCEPSSAPPGVKITGLFVADGGGRPVARSDDQPGTSDTATSQTWATLAQGARFKALCFQYSGKTSCTQYVDLQRNLELRLWFEYEDGREPRVEERSRLMGKLIGDISKFLGL